MESEAPAGYFSTFSILDPNNISAEGATRPHRRNRRVFVCLPCHRRKLRCDKKQPCSRCVASGAPGDCVYQPFPSTAAAAESTPTPRFREGPDATTTPPRVSLGNRCRADYRHSDGRARVSGPTHWANIASEVSGSTASVS